MRSKLIIPGIVAVSLLAPAVAFAQSEKSMAPAEGKTEAMPPKAMHHARSTHMMHHARTTHMKRGTTIGMGSGARARPGGESVSRKPAD